MFLSYFVNTQHDLTLFFFEQLAKEGERQILFDHNCTTFRTRFLKAEHNFGMEENVTLTTFYVYVYDFHTPLWIQISFSQYPKLNLQQFFITFST